MIIRILILLTTSTLVTLAAVAAFAQGTEIAQPSICRPFEFVATQVVPGLKEYVGAQLLVTGIETMEGIEGNRTWIYAAPDGSGFAIFRESGDLVCMIAGSNEWAQMPELEMDENS